MWYEATEVCPIDPCEAVLGCRLPFGGVQKVGHLLFVVTQNARVSVVVIWY